MVLKVLGSSSRGNCYILDNGQEALIVEAGVDYKRILKGLDYNLSKVVGCVITHEHRDHCKSLADVLKAGITTLALPSVFELAKNKLFTKTIEEGSGYVLGRFVVIPFHVRHDVPCVGWLISHPDMGRMLFVTDTMSLDYKFSNLNYVLIEANYADGILQERIDSGSVPAAMRSRLYHSHMEIETTKKVLQAQDLSDVKQIVLIHLSDGSSDEARFVREITEATGTPTVAAKSDMTIELGY